MQRAEFATLALNESNLVNRAKVAVDIDDLKSAEHYWDEALRRYPTFAKWHESALTVLLALRRYDEADALMLEGLKRGQRRIALTEGMLRSPSVGAISRRRPCVGPRFARTIRPHGRHMFKV